MGKKNKSYDELTSFQKRQKTFELAKQFGIDKNDYNWSNSGREQFSKKGDFGDLEDAVAGAMANDYDVRRSLEAARLSATDDKEKEKLKGLAKGISHMGEAHDIHQWMKRVHKKDLENTGAFSSANDYANITDFFVNRDRDGLLEQLNDLTKEKEGQDKPEEAPELTPEDEEIQDKYAAGYYDIPQQSYGETWMAQHATNQANQNLAWAKKTEGITSGNRYGQGAKSSFDTKYSNTAKTPASSGRGIGLAGSRAFRDNLMSFFRD